MTSCYMKVPSAVRQAKQCSALPYLEEILSINYTQFICNEELPLHRVPALVTQLTAVSRTELHLPHDRLLMLLHLEEIPISHHSLFLQGKTGMQQNIQVPSATSIHVLFPGLKMPSTCKLHRTENSSINGVNNLLLVVA